MTNHRAFGKQLRPVFWVCVGLSAAVAVVFGQSVGFDFVNIDDDIYVYENPVVRQGLTASSIKWAFTDTKTTVWTPLTQLSLLVDSQIYGTRPGGYHLTNVLLHAATVLTMFFAFFRMTGRLLPCAFAAALFAVHPLRAESVAWVTERKDVLSGLFFMLTLWAYAGYSQHRFSWLRYFLVAAFFLLGLMSKSMLVTLPAVLLLLDYWPLGRWSAAMSGTDPVFSGDNEKTSRVRAVARLVLEKLPLLLIAAVIARLTLEVQGETLAPNERLSLAWRMGTASINYVTYLGMFFWPAGLAVYPRFEGNLPAWKIAGAAIVLIAVTAAAVWQMKSRPYLAVGWFWYLITLAPVSGVIQVGVNSLADRFTYLTQAGIAVGLTWLVAGTLSCTYTRRPFSDNSPLPLGEGQGVRAVSLAAVSVLAVLAASAWRQTGVWRDSKTLWTHSLQCTQGNAIAHTNLGLVLAAEGDHEGAIANYRTALKVAPKNTLIRRNLGNALMASGKNAEATAVFRAILESKPGHVAALNNLGILLAREGRFDEAAECFEKSLTLDRDRPARYHLLLGNARMAGGKYREATGHFQQALSIEPENVEALRQSALLLASCPDAALRNGPQALMLAERAKMISRSQEPEIFEALAAAYAELGRFDEAIAAQGEAMLLARQRKQAVGAIRSKMELYRSGKPYRP